MIHGFYFRFYKYIHIQWLCVLLSHMAYALFFCKYLVERMFHRKSMKTDLDYDKAYDLISGLYPKPEVEFQLNRETVDDRIDVSIIVPVYNHAETLKKNIEAILSQKTQYRFQLILVDDGSTDGAQDIVKQYADHENVKIIIQKNQGIGGARNTGLAHANGKYFMFVDCDDTVEETLVETLMQAAYQNDSDIVMCAHNLVKTQDSTAYSFIPNIYPDLDMMGYSDEAYILNFAGLPWDKVYKRELWDQVSYLPGYWFEDTIIHCLLFTQCKRFVYIPKICYQYYWYENNFSHTQGKGANLKNIDIYWMLCDILKQYERMNLPRDEKFEIILLKHLSLYYYSKIAGLDENVINALFVLACHLYKEYGNQDIKVPYMLNETRKALLEKDIELWKLTLRYQK